MKFFKPHYYLLAITAFTVVTMFGFLALSGGYSNNVLASDRLAQAPQSFPSSPTADDQPSDAGGFVPCGNRADDPCNISHLFRAFIVIINYLISMAGFVAVLFIVFAGVKMVYSQGQEVALKDAKSRLTGAIIGLVLVAIAYITINTLLTGSLSIGISEGGKILTNPVDYIKGPPPPPPTSTGGGT